MSSYHLIFGTGPVGRAIMATLLAQGEPVCMVNRSGRGDWPAAVAYQQGDVRDAGWVREVARGAKVVYQALNAPYHRWPVDFPPLQAGLLAGLAGLGVPLVVLENVYMYGDTGGAPMWEDSPLRATSRKGRVRAAMSEALMAAHAAGTVPVVIGRAADFVGPEVRQSVLGDRLVPNLLRGKAVQLMGDPAQPHSFTYMPDIGRALVRLGQEPTAWGKVWHLPSPAPLPVQEVVERLAAAAGMPARIQVVPPWLLKAVGWLSPAVAEFPEMLYQWTQPFLLRDQAIAEAYGLQATPWETIVPATVAWWQRELAATPVAV